MVKQYRKLADTERHKLLHLIYNEGYSIKKASEELDIPYANSKFVNQIYLRENRTTKKQFRERKPASHYPRQNYGISARLPATHQKQEQQIIISTESTKQEHSFENPFFQQKQKQNFLDQCMPYSYLDGKRSENSAFGTDNYFQNFESQQFILNQMHDKQNDHPMNFDFKVYYNSINAMLPWQ